MGAEKRQLLRFRGLSHDGTQRRVELRDAREGTEQPGARGKVGRTLEDKADRRRKAILIRVAQFRRRYRSAYQCPSSWHAESLTFHRDDPLIMSSRTRLLSA